MSTIPPREIADCNRRLADIYQEEVHYYYVDEMTMDDETMRELTGIVGELRGEAWLQKLKSNLLEGARGL